MLNWQTAVNDTKSAVWVKSHSIYSNECYYNVKNIYFSQMSENIFIRWDIYVKFANY